MENNNLLKNKFPDLLKEWDFTKNQNININTVTYGSGKKVYWICPKKHLYQATIASRTHMKSGCPYCAGKKVLKGYNDLLTKYPEICKEWDYSKNKINPDEVTCGSNKSVWWKCSCGYEWKTYITMRTNQNSQCPRCRDNKTSFNEQTIYYYLKENGYSPINRYKYKNKEIDIYIPKENIGIEYNGLYWHRNRKEKDREKEKILSEDINMFYLIESDKNRKYKNKIYFAYKNSRNNSFSWAINKLFKLLKFNILVNLKKDYQKIYSLFLSNKLENSLAYKYPLLLKEWDYSKNIISPEKVTAGSNIKVWWICSKGHSFTSYINLRTGQQSGCPYCSGNKTLKGFNDLLTLKPGIAKDWDYEKNTIKPDEISCSSNKRIWWKCKNNHLRETRVVKRVQSNGCPLCNKINRNGERIDAKNCFR